MKRFTIADYLSIYRIVAVPLLLYAIAIKRKKAFVALSAVSLATDAADGFVARQLDQETRRGAKLDSAGDLVTFICLATGIALFNRKFVAQNRMVFSGLVGLYLAQLAIAYIKYRKFTSFHTYSSKLGFAVMSVFCLLLLTYKDIRWLFYTSSVLMATAVIEDIVLVFLLDKPRQNVKGIYWLKKPKLFVAE